MLGGIQPVRLRDYMDSATDLKLQDDGLLQRFQLLVWPDANPEYTYTDRKPRQRRAAQRVEKMFRRIVKLDPTKPVGFRFSPDAQALFITWLEHLEFRLRGGYEGPLVTSHLSKFRSLMPKLAALFQLSADILGDPGFEGFEGLRVNVQMVTNENAQRAVNFCSYLESHARSHLFVSDERGEKSRDSAGSTDQGRSHRRRRYSEEPRCVAAKMDRPGYPGKANKAIQILVDSDGFGLLSCRGKLQGGRPTSGVPNQPAEYGADRAAT